MALGGEEGKKKEVGKEKKKGGRPTGRLHPAWTGSGRKRRGKRARKKGTVTCAENLIPSLEVRNFRKKKKRKNRGEERKRKKRAIRKRRISVISSPS